MPEKSKRITRSEMRSITKSNRQQRDRKKTPGYKPFTLEEILQKRLGVYRKKNVRSKK